MSALSVGRPALDCQAIPGLDLPVSTVPSASVMLDESVSITIRTALIAPFGRFATPSSSVAPPCSASRLIFRFGVASVTKSPVDEVSAESDAETLTMYRSTRATRLYGKGESVSSVWVALAPGSVAVTPSPQVIVATRKAGKARKRSLIPESKSEREQRALSLVELRALAPA